MLANHVTFPGRKLTNFEVSELQDAGYGYCCFMGGVSGHHKEIIVELDGCYYLMTPEQSRSKEVQVQLERESREYFTDIRA